MATKRVTANVEFTVEVDENTADLLGALIKRNGLDLFPNATPWTFYEYDPHSKVVSVFVDGEEAR